MGFDLLEAGSVALLDAFDEEEGSFEGGKGKKDSFRLVGFI